MKRNKRISLVFKLMAFISILMGFIGGSIQLQSSFVKVLYIMTVYFSLVLVIINRLRFNYFDRTAKKIILIYFIIVFVSLLRSIFDTTVSIVGNKWITLFGNEEFLPMLLAPIFIFVANTEDVISRMNKVQRQLSYVILLLFLFRKYTVLGMLWFGSVFYHNSNKLGRILLLIVLGISTIPAFFAKETSRTSIIVMMFSVLSYILVYIVKNKKLVIMFCVLCMIAPIFYSLPLLSDTGDSIIKDLLELLMDRTGDSQLATDTRSFLFWEMSQDLSNTNSWIFGKGAYSTYYSSWFDENALTRGQRFSVEVTFLMLLLRGGIVLAISYYSILAYSVYCALKRSNNRFLLSAAIMISGWFFVSSFSFVNGCGLYHLMFYTLVGCCLSSYWLKKTDKEIESLLKI